MVENERGGAAGAETSDIGAVAAPGRERRMTAGRKRDAVLRVLRGEPLEIVARELAATAADLSGWRDDPPKKPEDETTATDEGKDTTKA
jgi:hypothetical protein